MLRDAKCRWRRVCRYVVVVLTIVGSSAAVAQTNPGTGTNTFDPYDPYRTEQQRDAEPSQAEQAGQNAADAQVAAPSSNERYRPDAIEGDPRTREQRDRRDRDDDPRAADRTPRPPRLAPPSEFELYVSRIADKPLRRFGANLLVPEARDFTAPPTTTVPTDYRLNPGDELVLGLTGTVQTDNLRVTIDSDGRIFVPRIGEVTVGGVRYGDVQSVIARQVARQYRDFRVAVTIGELRGITVYVTGFAATPGSYTISSLSTLVNAVLAAGGPAAGGSFRSIQVRREGRLIADFDLYDLLLKGDKSADVVMQNGDVIYIAPAGAQVAVIGSANTEAIFEARAGETLNDVLLYAGGVSTAADDTRLLVLDPLDPQGAGWQQLTPADVQTRVARRAQVVRILSGLGIARPLAKQPVLVTISGEVANPGRYYLQPGVTLANALAQAGGLTPQAYTFGSVFTRDTLRAQQRETYQRALRDVQFLLTAQPLVSARSGEQLQPARQQAIRSLVEQLENRAPDGRLVLDIDPRQPALPSELTLENNDTLYVPPAPVTVGVFGSVPSPGSFQLQPNARLRDYLKSAGGPQSIADAGDIFVVRANGSLLAPRRGLFAGNILNQRALPGDLIFVPVDADRGEFWARLRDITSVVFQGALAAGTVAAISNE